MSDRESWPEAPELAGPPVAREKVADSNELLEEPQNDAAGGEIVADSNEVLEEPQNDAAGGEIVADSNEVLEEPQNDAAGEEIVADSNVPEAEHAAGDFSVPDGYGVLQGAPQGGRRAVGIVVSRFNGAVTSRLLEGALVELEDAGVAREAITVMPVPGAFELPIAAMALAKTRRYACIVALGCVIRGDTPHFDYVAGEAASGLQLAALETGVPVAFGVLTLEEAGQADGRLEKGREAVRTGLEMADVFAQLRAAAQR